MTQLLDNPSKSEVTAQDQAQAELKLNESIIKKHNEITPSNEPVKTDIMSALSADSNVTPKADLDIEVKVSLASEATKKHYARVITFIAPEGVEVGTKDERIVGGHKDAAVDFRDLTLKEGQISISDKGHDGKVAYRMAERMPDGRIKYTIGLFNDFAKNDGKMHIKIGDETLTVDANGPTGTVKASNQIASSENKPATEAQPKSEIPKDNSAVNPEPSKSAAPTESKDNIVKKEEKAAENKPEQKVENQELDTKAEVTDKRPVVDRVERIFERTRGGLRNLLSPRKNGTEAAQSEAEVSGNSIESKKEEDKTATSTEKEQKRFEIVSEAKTKQDIDGIIEQSFQRPVVVRFTASWCGPCQLLKPKLDAAVLNKNGQLGTVAVDIDNPAMSAFKEQNGVQSIPHVTVIYQGNSIPLTNGSKGLVGNLTDNQIQQLVISPSLRAVNNLK